MSRDDNVQEILGTIGPFWAKLGLRQVPHSFFCVVSHATFRQLRNGRFSPNLVTKRTFVSCRGIWKDILENFHFRGHFPPKSKIENQSNRHLTQVTGCTAEILFTPRCSPMVREFLRSVNFSLRRTVAELRSIKVAQFSILAYFPHTKPLKRTFRWPAYIAEWFRFFHVIVEGPKGCPPAPEFSWEFWYGSWEPPNLSKFPPMENGYIHAQCNWTAHQI